MKFMDILVSQGRAEAMAPQPVRKLFSRSFDLARSGVAKIVSFFWSVERVSLVALRPPPILQIFTTKSIHEQF